MRRILLVLLICVSGCAVPRPTVSPSTAQWSDVTALSPGFKVRVWWFDPSVANVRTMRVEGTLVRADETGVVVKGKRGERTLTREQVHRVDGLYPIPDRLTNGAVIGASVGAGYGGFLTAVFAGTDESVGAAPIVTATLLGAFVGALIDSLKEGPQPRTIYFQPRPFERR
jgi:hypothetical protein